MGSSGTSRAYENQMLDLTRQQMADNQAYRQEQQARVDAQKQQYRAFEFTNPFEDMENVFEDVTVSQEAARFQMEQGRQQRANIMASLSGAAGASGIAGLAQSLAQQGTMQARQVSADIAQQEAANQQLITQGASQADILGRQGAAAVQAARFGREATMYAGELGELAGARAAEQAAFGNQMGALGMSASNAASRQSSTNQLLASAAMAKIYMTCIPRGIHIDCIDGTIAIEDINPGDIVIGYDGAPVKVLQKHNYLENPDIKSFCKVCFKDNDEIKEVNVSDMHRIRGVRSKDITENVVSKEFYGSVKYTYDLLTEDAGYRISGIPVNSMIEEMACLTAELLNDK